MRIRWDVKALPCFQNVYTSVLEPRCSCAGNHEADMLDSAALLAECAADVL
jgi:hypothetical protein